MNHKTGNECNKNVSYLAVFQFKMSEEMQSKGGERIEMTMSLRYLIPYTLIHDAVLERT